MMASEVWVNTRFDGWKPFKSSTAYTDIELTRLVKADPKFAGFLRVVAVNIPDFSVNYPKAMEALSC